MRRMLPIILLLIPAISIGAQENRVRFSDTPSRAIIQTQDVGRTVLRLEIGEVRLEAGEGDSSKLALPEAFGLRRGEVLSETGEVLPTLTYTLSIPFDAPPPTMRVVGESWEEIEGITLAKADPEQRQALSGGVRLSSLESSFFWGEEAGTMRDLRLYSVTILPAEYDQIAGKLRLLRELELEVSHPGSQITRQAGVLSEAFLPVYRALVDNPQVFDPILPTRGAYWIIYPDAFAGNIAALSDWKKAKGFEVVAIPKSTIGANPNYLNVKNYILARFDSCRTKPDYITLLGDVTMPNDYDMPTRTFDNPFGFGDIESDNFYTFLHGSDYFPEVFIGRISFDYLGELETYIGKLFSYERTPYMAETQWYLRGTMVAGSDGGSFVSPRLTKLWVREAMLEHGYTEVDTFFATYDGQIQPYMINASIDQGVSFVNYRGFGGAYYWSPPYYSNDNILELNNGPMYPIMTSIVCGTGDYNDQSDVCFGETWIRADGRGGVGFIGNSNHDAHTRWTNAIDVGIYWGLFFENVATLAQAELMGKMTLYNAFPSDRQTGGQVELYFNSYNLLGDPEVNVWTGVPGALAVTHPETIPLGQNRVDVHVQNAGGNPVEGAIVSIWKEGEIFQAAFSAADGDALFEASALTAGPMRLTVTARGYIPVEDTVTYISNQTALAYSSHTIDDDAVGESNGDGDGIMNPPETIELSVALTNIGPALDTSFGVTAVITCETPGVTFVRDSASYQTIAPGQTVSPVAPFVLRLANDIPDGTVARLLMAISDLRGGQWQAIFHSVISAARVEFDSVTIIDNANGRIDPGDYFDIVAYGRNTGSKPLAAGTMILRSGETKLHLLDTTAAFAACPPGGVFNNDSDRFNAWVDSDIFNGRVINFATEFVGGPQAISAAFSQTVGQVTSRDPIGPDAYGYYCYDNTDSSSLTQPNYAWIEIDAVNWPRVTLDDEQVATILLPFPVKYYGQTYGQLTICDNGFVTMGETDWPNFYNGPIPAPQNPEAMIAPFWDDFSQSPLRVYYFHDTVAGKFIVGWRNAFDRDNNYTQTFEIIFLDEAVFPTRTDDNEIFFQYNNIRNTGSMSVGICSPDRRDGICYTFNSLVTPGAAPLANGRAIKFSTGSMYEVGVDDQPMPEVFGLARNYPNPFNAGTTIEFSLASAGSVKLEVFNIVGQMVATLIEGELGAGAHRAIWDASGATSGTYFYRLSFPGSTTTRRMTLIK